MPCFFVAAVGGNKNGVAGKLAAVGGHIAGVAGKQIQAKMLNSSVNHLSDEMTGYLHAKTNRHRIQEGEAAAYPSSW